MFRFARYGGYECSSKGDRRFSAFYARLKDGRTIEEAYQLDVKGYRIYGNNPMLGKGKPPINRAVDTWLEYLALWETWAKENPRLIEELKTIALKHSCTLSDMFAKTPVNQANTLVHILNRKEV